MPSAIPFPNPVECTTERTPYEAAGNYEGIGLKYIHEEETILDVNIEVNASDLLHNSSPECLPPQKVSKILRRLHICCAGADVVTLKGELPSWLLCAIAATISPTVLQLEQVDEMGVHKLLCTPLPIDAGGSTCGVEIEAYEMGEQVVIQVRRDPEQFTYLRFDDIVAPPIAPGLRVLLRGEIPAPIAVALALTYEAKSDSLWVATPEKVRVDVCAISHCADCVPGDRMICEIQRERIGHDG